MAEPATSSTCRLCVDAAIKDPSKEEIIEHRKHPGPMRKANPNPCPVGPFMHQGKLMDPLHLCAAHRKEIDNLPSEHWPIELRLTAEQREEALRLGMTWRQYLREVVDKKP